MSAPLPQVMPPSTTSVCVVLDTNIVLDLWLYQDPATSVLHVALADKTVQWLATQVMRDELERVLAYTHIVARMSASGITADHILNRFDAYAQLMPVASKAQFVCKDADDQKFIDLAAAHAAQLISKDKAVLTMRNRMARLGVAVGRSFAAQLP
jgi:putative PIN family toxin of toxin-antitoxin system